MGHAGEGFGTASHDGLGEHRAAEPGEIVGVGGGPAADAPDEPARPVDPDETVGDAILVGDHLASPVPVLDARGGTVVAQRAGQFPHHLAPHPGRLGCGERTHRDPADGGHQVHVLRLVGLGHLDGDLAALDHWYQHRTEVEMGVLEFLRPGGQRVDVVGTARLTDPQLL